MEQEKYAVAQELMGIYFQDTSLLEQALRHPSVSLKQGKTLINNQRLEFLGDAVLKLAISQILYELFPLDDEGRLSQIRSFIVSDELLALVAEEISLAQFIKMSKEEERTGGRKRSTVLADTMEALLGAYFIDNNSFDSTCLLIRRLFIAHIEETASQKIIEYKTALQEYCQRLKIGLPEYRLLSANGPEHQKIFFVACSVSNNGKLFTEESFAHSLKIAEKLAAKKLLEKLYVSKKN